MALLQISHLTFGYEGSYDTVFEDLSVQLDTNWRLGLVGRNGRGKTTLLDLLRGRLRPQGGSITGPAQECGYFPCEAPDPQAPAADVLRTLAPGVPGWQLLRELNRLELREDALRRPFGALSGGERTKILLAALFLRDGAFPLIDEPTNHLAARGRAVLSRYLAGKNGFLVVSHDRAFLDGCVDHILALNKTGAQVQAGNFSCWYAEKCRRDAFEQAQNKKLERELARLQAAAGRAAAWSDKVEKSKRGSRNSGLRPDRGYIGHKSAKMMKRAKCLEARSEKAVEEKSALLKDLEHAPALRLSGAAPARPVRLVQAAPSYGGRPVCAPVSVTVQPGSRVALAGPNGSGKTTLLRLLCGEPVAHTGRVLLPGGLRIARVPQDTAFLRGSLRAFAAQNGIDETQFKTILRKLDFSRSQLDKDMAEFSAGQKKKVLIAQSLCGCPELLVWDEPLNFIDVFSRMQIEELLLAAAPTMVFVEHDQAFCRRIATQVVELAPPD